MSIFYKDSERYTPLATEIDLEIFKALHPIFMRRVAEGIAVREIALLVHGVVADITVTTILNRAVDLKKSCVADTKVVSSNSEIN